MKYDEETAVTIDRSVTVMVGAEHIHVLTTISHTVYAQVNRANLSITSYC
jgi:hypothetical protein